MFFKVRRYFVALAAISTALAGCGSGNVTVDSTPNTYSQSYPPQLSPLPATVAAAPNANGYVVSIAGPAIYTSAASTPLVSLDLLSGSYQTRTGYIEIQGRPATVRSHVDGWEGRYRYYRYYAGSNQAILGGVLLKGGTTVYPVDQFASGSYRYVKGVLLMSGTGASSLGYAGVQTPLADIPATGTAQYRGNVFVTYFPTNSGSSGAQMTGDSTVLANFGAGTVDVTFGNLVGHARDPLGSGWVNVVPALTDITGTGLTISGNRFGGGIWSLSNAGTNITLGAPTSALAAGYFYGVDAAGGKPDEVAGIVLMEGSVNSLRALYVAD